MIAAILWGVFALSVLVALCCMEIIIEQMLDIWRLRREDALLHKDGKAYDESER